MQGHASRCRGMCFICKRCAAEQNSSIFAQGPQNACWTLRRITSQGEDVQTASTISPPYLRNIFARKIHREQTLHLHRWKLTYPAFNPKTLAQRNPMSGFCKDIASRVRRSMKRLLAWKFRPRLASKSDFKVTLSQQPAQAPSLKRVCSTLRPSSCPPIQSVQKGL